MGDRCYSRHRIQRSRLADHVATFGESDGIDEETPYEVVGYFEELNYGGSVQYESFAASGMAFIVCNEQGGEYGPHELVSDGARFSECETLDGGDLAVSIDSETGDPRARELGAARRHLEIRRNAERILADPFPTVGGAS